MMIVIFPALRSVIIMIGMDRHFQVQMPGRDSSHATASWHVWVQSITKARPYKVS